MSRSSKYFVGLPILFALALGAAIGLSGSRQAAVPLAHAQGCSANPACAGENPDTKTSNIFVEHEYTSGGTTYAVKPDAGETWDITARWYDGNSLTCSYYEETASVTVSWNGSIWALSNQNLTNSIIGISLCSHGTGCSGANQNVFGYRLLVNVKDNTAYPLLLKDVYYETTSVDDGDQLLNVPSPCSNLGTSVSPTSQTFGVYDAPGTWGSGRCPFTCSASNGPTIDLTYQ